MPNDTFAVVLPSPGPGAYATTINQAIEEIRDKLEPKVPVADFEVDEDLPFGNHAATGVGYMAVQNRGAAPAPALTIYVRSNDWYCKDAAGNEIRLTSGGAIAATLDLNGSHGSRFVQIPADMFVAVSGSPVNFTNGRGVGSSAGSANFIVGLPVLRRGDRILSITGTFSVGLAAGTTTINLKRRNADLLAPTTLGNNTSTSTTTPLNLTLGSLSETIASGVSYVLDVTTKAANDALETITVEYDRP